MIADGVGLEPVLGEQDVDEHVGRRPRRGDADLHALEVRAATCTPRPSPSTCRARCRRTCPAAPAPRCSGPSPAGDRVLVRARHDVDAAADQRLQRLRAAGEVVDLDVEPLGLEIAVALGDRERQIVEQRLAADGDGELRLFRAPARRRRRDERASANASTTSVTRRRMEFLRNVAVDQTRRAGYSRGEGARVKRDGRGAARRAPRPTARRMLPLPQRRSWDLRRISRADAHQRVATAAQAALALALRDARPARRRTPPATNRRSRAVRNSASPKNVASLRSPQPNDGRSVPTR